MEVDPAHKATKPKVEKEDINPLSEAEVRQFMIAARSSRLNALYHLAGKTGMRQGEWDIRFHDLRHTAASIMLKNGIPLVDASRYLGHSSPSVTLNLYAHLLPGGLENTAKVMDALLTQQAVAMQPALHEN